MRLQAVRQTPAPRRPAAPTGASAPAADPVRAALVADTLALVGARPVQPVATRLAALAGARPERPDFKSPEDFKNYAVKLASYLKAAEAELAAAERDLAALKASRAKLEADYRRPLEEAKQTLADTQALYQAPVGKLESAIPGAKAELDAAIWPGKARAAELDRQAAAVAKQIDELDRSLTSAIDRLGSLDGLIAQTSARQAEAEDTKAAAEAEIQRLTRQIPPGGSLDSQVSSARFRQDAAERELSQAESALDSAIRAGESRLASLEGEARRQEAEVARRDAEVRDMQSRLASFDSQVTSYEARRRDAESRRASADAEIRRLSPLADAGAIDAQRAKVRDAESRLASAASAVSGARARVSRLDALEGQIDQLASTLAQYDSAVDSRSSYKGHVTRKKAELDAAMMGGEFDEIDRAKAEYDEMVAKYAAADQRVQALASQMAAYGANRDNVNGILSSKRSELSGLSGAQGELDRALSAQSSAQSAVGAEKGRLSQMEGLVSELQRQVRARDEAARAVDEAARAIASLQADKSRIQNVLPSRQSELSGLRWRAQNARSSANEERSRQGSSYYLRSERDRVASARSRHDAARRDHGVLADLAAALRAQASRRDGAASTIQQAIASREGYIREKAQLPATIDQRQAQLETQTQARSALVAEASRERARKNPDGHPQVSAARTRLAGLEAELRAARAAYETAVAGPQARLAEQQAAYNQNVAALQTRLDAGDRALASAREDLAAAKKDFDGLSSAVGGFKAMWWKLFHHFSVGEFLDGLAQG